MHKKSYIIWSCIAAIQVEDNTRQIIRCIIFRFFIVEVPEVEPDVYILDKIFDICITIRTVGLDRRSSSITKWFVKQFQLWLLSYEK